MLKDISPTPSVEAIQTARRLRRQMTKPEAVLWRELRKRPQGLKFRRQHPTGQYILDFYCSDARLAVEIDGFVHDTLDQAQADAIRDAWFVRCGISTLRIPAKAVLSNLESVLTYIVNEALRRIQK